MTSVADGVAANVPAALPADAVLVHIGPHKTGTSAIQSIAEASRETMRAHGVDYAGKAPAHHRAAKALRHLAGGWEHDPEAPKPEKWPELVRDVQASPGRVLVSSEFFAQADAKARARLVHDLGADRVHVVLAARDPLAVAVSTWQQVLRQGYPVTLESWLESNFRRSEIPERPTGFWSWADAAALVASWAEVLPPERITVIVLNEQDRSLLPTTFEQLLGLPKGLLADAQAPDVNRGLTAAEAALLRRIINLLGSRLSWDDYTRVMRFGVIMRLLRSRKPGPDEAKTAPPAWAVEQAAVEAKRTIARLRDSGTNIVGDLDALGTTRGPATDTESITHVPLEVAAEAVVGAVAAAIDRDHTLDAPTLRPRKKAKGRTVESLSTRELMRILGKRVRKAARRRVSRVVPRLPLRRTTD